MCGRYTLHSNESSLREALELSLPEDYSPKYNLGPAQSALAVYRKPDDSTTCAVMMQWGLRTPQNFHINARIETAGTTPRFREAWQAQRCLLPANGFYEWYQDGIRKQPYYIYSADPGLLYFAGLYFVSSEASIPNAFVILTMAATTSVHKIHERMPVLLPLDTHRAWLGGTATKETAQDAAMNIQLASHTVSQRVNSNQNQDSQLITASSPLTDDQMMLF